MGKAYKIWLNKEQDIKSWLQITVSTTLTYYCKQLSLFFNEVHLLYSAGQFLLEESRLTEAAEMAKTAAELDSTEFDVVFNAAHMLRLVFVSISYTDDAWKRAIHYINFPAVPIIAYVFKMNHADITS